MSTTNLVQNFLGTWDSEFQYAVRTSENGTEVLCPTVIFNNITYVCNYTFDEETNSYLQPTLGVTPNSDEAWTAISSGGSGSGATSINLTSTNGTINQVSQSYNVGTQTINLDIEATATQHIINTASSQTITALLAAQIPPITDAAGNLYIVNNTSGSAVILSKTGSGSITGSTPYANSSATQIAIPAGGCALFFTTSVNQGNQNTYQIALVSYYFNVVNGVAGLDSTGLLLNSVLPTGIDASKIADGSVGNTEFQYLSGASSNIQDQIDGITLPSVSNSFNVADASAAGLTFSFQNSVYNTIGSIVFANVSFTYPTTSDSNAASVTLSGVPNTYKAMSFLIPSSAAGVNYIVKIIGGTNRLTFYNATDIGVQLTNSDLSGITIYVNQLVYASA